MAEEGEEEEEEEEVVEEKVVVVRRGFATPVNAVFVTPRGRRMPSASCAAHAQEARVVVAIALLPACALLSTVTQRIFEKSTDLMKQRT